MKNESAIIKKFDNHLYNDVIYLIEKYQTKIKKIPQAQLIIMLATSYEKNNKLDKAIQILENYSANIKLSPDNIDILNLNLKLAEFYIMFNKTKNAVNLITSLEKYINNKHKLYIDLLITAGYIYSESSNQKNAEKYLLNARKFVLDNNLNISYYYKILTILSIVAYRKGILKDAIIFAKEVIVNSSNVEKEVLATAYHYYAIFKSVMYNQIDALHYNTLSLKLFSNLNDKRNIIKIYISLGLTYLNIGETLLAENLLNKALDLTADSQEYKQKGRIYSGLGHINIIKGNYSAALKFFSKDYQYAKKFNNPHISAYPLRNIGRVNMLIGKKELALEIFEKSAKLFKKVGDEVNYAISLSEIAECIAETSTIADIKKLINKAKKIFKQKSREIQLAFLEYKLAKIYSDKTLFKQAEKSFKYAESILKKYESYSRLNDVLFNLGKLYLVQKKYKSAVNYLAESYRYSKEYNFSYMIPKIIELLDNLDKMNIINIGTEYILQKEKYKAEHEVLKEDIKKYSKITTFIIKNPKMKEIINDINDIAPTDIPILITGETGTGKELIARYIHMKSNRKDFPLVTVNCGAIPENLIESELFGHKKGSFTGAVSDYKGKFKMANNGTIFLDEIGELSLNAQKSLLRFLQDGEIQPVGSTLTEIVNVRVIAATNKNIANAVQNKEFREDLFYRLNSFTILIPPLRKRKDELEILVNHFISYFSKKHSKNVTGITNDAIQILLSYDWPGNIRELENIIEIAVIRSSNKLLHSILFSDLISKHKNPKLMTLEKYESRYIAKVLKYTNFNYSKTAEILGIHRNTLYKKINKLNISAPK